MSSDNPHIANDYSPLDAMIVMALRRFGEFHPSTIDADTAQLFIECANEVVHDWNTHPYVNTGSPKISRVTPYISQTEARAIPDPIMVSGLLAYYAMQQGSPKGQLYMPRYNRMLNRGTWEIISDSGPIRLRTVDGGPSGFGLSMPITGMPQ